MVDTNTIIPIALLYPTNENIIVATTAWSMTMAEW